MLKYSLLLVILLFFSFRRPSENPPNLIIILADDLGYGDVGFNGCKDIPTPNIDRIAENGVVCTQAYVTYSVCGPSRAGLITGRYQDRFGFSRNPLFTPKDSSEGLPLSEMTLATALKQANYKTAALGKWHLGAHPSQRPNQRGFDEFYGFLTGGHDYFPEKWNLADEKQVKSQYAAYRTKLLRNTQRVEENEYLTDALSREAVNYIDQFKIDPFFIYLAYNAPHQPLQATEKYLQRFSQIKDEKRRTYAAMVSAVDDGVGRILDQLDRLNLTENTIVVFLSDNGGPEQHNASDNGPLRGTKGTLFEGGIRVPFAIQWPKNLPAGEVFEKPISSLDIFATMVAFNNKSIQLSKELDGVNIIPYLAGAVEGLPHDYLFWRKFDDKNYAMVANNFKMLITPNEGDNLYDLKSDIAEERNIISEERTRFEEFSLKYRNWENQLIDPVFLGLSKDKEYNILHPDRFIWEE